MKSYYYGTLKIKESQKLNLMISSNIAFDELIIASIQDKVYKTKILQMQGQLNPVQK